MSAWSEYVYEQISRSSGLVTAMKKSWQNHSDPGLALEIYNRAYSERARAYRWKYALEKREAGVHNELGDEERKAAELSVREAGMELVWSLFEIDRLASIFDIPKHLDDRRQESAEEKEAEERRRKRQDKFRKIREGEA